ncbi:murein hydrolase activator EnvC family protein [Cognatiluteimonas lumbrici]|uniref:murein hydrolase activator EnvC family protein n=1 Tax=Cognatiluteimonas lumbrici TaxID=2559601 RepID=UPI00112B8057|nr:peptidoglycan DD-metalloendopeptidase family protein [Luteimonas lumbrici]
MVRCREGRGRVAALAPLLQGLAIASFALAVGFGAQVWAQDSGDAQRRLERAQRELREVAAERRRIENARGAASRELRAMDERLAKASRALHDTDAELARQRKALADAQAREKQLAQNLAAQRAQLAALLRAAYTVGSEAPLKLLLSQDRVAEAARVLTLHRYLQQDRTRRIAALSEELRELEELGLRIAEQERELEATRARQREQLAALQAERKRHAEAVAKLDASYQDKRSREKALGSDVAGLRKLLAQLRAAAERAEAERRAAAERARRAAAEAGAPPPKPAPVPAQPALRVGGLGWPLSGSLIAGYGGKLPDGGKSSGLMIGAPQGTTVQAVAPGKVVFADWMNGYGLILIIDHGNGYMSLYARNEALLRDAGDMVERGDPVASVGSSGGPGPPALYFELRRNGDPVNPDTWLKK